MHVFLTGATGYIGVAVAERLRKAGHSLSGLARSDAAAERLQATAVQPVRGDFADAATVGAAARAADATISMATGRAAGRRRRSIGESTRAGGSGEPWGRRRWAHLRMAARRSTEGARPVCRRAGAGPAGFRHAGAQDARVASPWAAPSRGPRTRILRLPRPPRGLLIESLSQRRHERVRGGVLLAVGEIERVVEVRPGSGPGCAGGWSPACRAPWRAVPPARRAASYSSHSSRISRRSASGSERGQLQQIGPLLRRPCSPPAPGSAPECRRRSPRPGRG